MALLTIPAADAIEIPAASRLLIRGRCLLKGWAVRETAGVTNARLALRDGTTASGRRIVPISLLANESTRDWLSEEGIAFEQGVFFELVAGTIEGSVWVIPEVRLDRVSVPLVDDGAVVARAGD